jgi:sulfur-oxidizing protein SoxB
MEQLMDQVAITYPQTSLTNMSGETIKTIMEDVCDNLFNDDPYYQQGGDMVRVGGIQYSVTPNAKIGNRISDMTLKGKPVDAKKTYKVAGWAPVAEGAKGAPIWEVVAEYLRDTKVVKQVKLNQPKVIGMGNNPGMIV